MVLYICNRGAFGGGGGGLPPLRNCLDAALCKNTVHSKMMNIALITVINKESQKCLQTVVTVVHIISQQ